MDPVELIQRLSVSLAIGLLIGIERGWQSRAEREGERAAGMRTHALAALLGGLWAAIAEAGGAGGYVALGVAFATLSGIVAVYRFRETGRDGTFGVTTVVAAMLSFTLGAFAVVGDGKVAAAAAVAAAGLLALKSALHDWVARLSWQELRSALLLLAMTFVILPLLPNRTVDPWASVNPFELWLMTIVLAAISFAGYVAVKIAGDRGGSIITGLAGGLASSTAVTLTLSRLARENPGQRANLVAGILISGATMMARVLVVVALVNAGLFGGLAPAIGVACLTLAGLGLLLLRFSPPEAASERRQLTLVNPFEIGTVLQLGALLTVVVVAAKVLTAAAGAAGAYVLAALSGVADVDAVTLSMSRLAGSGIARETAIRAICIVVAVNSLAKAGLGWMTGGPEVGRRLLAASAIAIAAGAAAFSLTPSI